jgi:hypothetical protein
MFRPWISFLLAEDHTLPDIFSCFGLLDGSAASEYKDAILTVLRQLIRRNIRIRSVVGNRFSSKLLAAGRTSEYLICDSQPSQ